MKREKITIGTRLWRSSWLLPAFTAVGVAALFLAGMVWLAGSTDAREEADVVVYKGPSCSCCDRWVEHLRDNDLSVAVINVQDTRSVKARLGVPQNFSSCHTAVAGDYWVEGHVPAELIQRLLSEKPDDLRGIAVPGMPIGSPGMEGPNPQQYQVVSLNSNGEVSVYATRSGRSAP